MSLSRKYRSRFVFSVRRLVSRRCHSISTISRLSLTPLRTVLAQFTHTAPHMFIHQIGSRLTVMRG